MISDASQICVEFVLFLLSVLALARGYVDAVAAICVRQDLVSHFRAVTTHSGSFGFHLRVRVRVSVIIAPSSLLFDVICHNILSLANLGLRSKDSKPV